MKNSIKDLYDQREVFPRFLYRYYEKTGVGGKAFQREIYADFEKFCAEKDLPLADAKLLGKHLMKVDGLLWHRTSGNQRIWYRLKRRAEPIVGTINPEDLHQWRALSLPMFEDGDEDPESFDVTRGRPRKGDAVPMPKRPVNNFIKGYHWGKIYRLYRQRRIFEKFKEKYVKLNPEWVVPREDVWRVFDEFCRAEAIPTCSAVQLRKGLGLQEQQNIDGSRDFIGLELRLNSQ